MIKLYCKFCKTPIKNGYCCNNIFYHIYKNYLYQDASIFLAKYNNFATNEFLIRNNEAEYKIRPEFSLSIPGRDNAEQFGKLIDNYYDGGVIIDIGCGPQGHPEYITDYRKLVGIDPLYNGLFDGLLRIKGYAEAMPIIEHEMVVFGTSLDHLLDWQLVLNDFIDTEKIMIWINIDKIPQIETDTQDVMGIEYVVPDGAIDAFHIHNVCGQDVIDFLQNSHKVDARTEYDSASEFIALIRRQNESLGARQ